MHKINEIIILITSLFFITKISSMDKDIMRSMDEQKSLLSGTDLPITSSLDKTENTESVWSLLPPEIKTKILNLCIYNLIQPRILNDLTHEKILNLKLIEMACNDIINDSGFFNTLRHDLNENSNYPIMLLALAKLTLSQKDSQIKEQESAQNSKEFIKDGKFIEDAFSKNDIKFLCESIKHGFNFNQRLKNAIKNDNKELALLLIKSGSILLDRGLGYGKKNPLTIAIEKGWHDVASVLIDNNAFLDTSMTICFTPLEAAIRKKNIPLIDQLIKNGVDVNKKHNKWHIAPIMIAAGDSNLEVVSKLIENGCLVTNKHEGTNWTPLMYAIKSSITSIKEKIEIVAKLILEVEKQFQTLGSENIMYKKNIYDYCSHINHQDRDGSTALMFACHSQLPEIVTLLINAGAKLDIQNNYGETALIIASPNSHNTEIVKQLIKAGADVNIQNRKGKTALMLAAKNCNNETVTLLINNDGAKLNLQDNKGRTALINVLYNKFNDIHGVIDQLIKAGADLNIQDNNGNTALMTAIFCNNYAVRRNILQIAKDLIQAGADINKQDPEGNTALTLALEDKNFELVKLLLENKADVKEKTYRLIVEMFREANRNNNLAVKQILAPYISFAEITKTAVPEACVIS